MDSNERLRIERLLEANQNRRAVDAIDALGLAGRTDPDMWFFRGKALLRLKNYSESLNSFREACKLNSNDATSTYYRGLAAERVGEYGEALAAYSKALRINPGMQEAERKIASLTSQSPALAEDSDVDARRLRSTKASRGVEKISSLDIPISDSQLRIREDRQTKLNASDFRAWWHGHRVIIVVLLSCMVALLIVGSLSYMNFLRQGREHTLRWCQDMANSSVPYERMPFECRDLVDSGQVTIP